MIKIFKYLVIIFLVLCSVSVFLGTVKRHYDDSYAVINCNFDVDFNETEVPLKFNNCSFTLRVESVGTLMGYVVKNMGK